MARPEAGLWDYLRGVLPAGIHYSRIESETSPGFPDVHYTLEGRSGTIELKSTKNPTGKYPFSGKDGPNKNQKFWIRDEIAADGVVYLCLERKPMVYLLRADLYYDELDRMTLTDIERVAILTWERGEDIRDRLAVALIPDD